MSTRRTVFLDRDGVINELVPDPASGLPESPLAVDDVVLLRGVGEAMSELAAAGYFLVGASNQPAAAKGTVSVDELQAVQDRVISLLAREGASFDDFRICLHHPDGVVPGLGGDCECRKPAPGLLLRAADAHNLDVGQSWMVGDSDSDVLAGHSAGTRTVLIEHPASAHRRARRETPTLYAEDLPSAVRLLLEYDHELISPSAHASDG